MSDLDATTPRIFLVRHGETEWTKNGRYTGTTDLELTHTGIAQVKGTASYLVGSGKLIDPARIARIWVSPRKRALQTLGLLFNNSSTEPGTYNAVITEDIAEWNYGDYEGLLVGESAQQVTERLDRLISEIREIQEPCMNGEGSADVVLVAHGHILRAFVKRWLKYPLDNQLPLMFSPGAIGILSYRNHDLDEPGFYLGMALPLQE